MSDRNPTPEAEMLKRALIDVFDLNDKISDDSDLIEIGQDREGRWIAWHLEYPEEGYVILGDDVCYDIYPPAQLKPKEKK